MRERDAARLFLHMPILGNPHVHRARFSRARARAHHGRKRTLSENKRPTRRCRPPVWSSSCVLITKCCHRRNHAKCLPRGRWKDSSTRRLTERRGSSGVSMGKPRHALQCLWFVKRGWRRIGVGRKAKKNWGTRALGSRAEYGQSGEILALRP